MRIDYKNKKLIDPEKIDQKEVEFAVKETSLDLDSAILNTEKELTMKQAKLAEIESTYPLDIQGHYDTNKDVELIEDCLARLKRLKDKLGL